MGIDNDGLKFLFATRAAGVSFRHTATLGRQGFSPSQDVLQKLLDSFGDGASASALLDQSKGFADKAFELLGAEEVVALDNSNYEGADIVADLNEPVDPALKNRFTAIFDGGCLEHVFNFPQAVRNCMELLTIGGHFIAVTPANNFCGHGFYQFSPELFFRIFARENGFTIQMMLTKDGGQWLRVRDPVEFGGRVEIQNNRPTYLFVLARKTDERSLFCRAPQQSDYVARWEQHQSPNHRPAASPSFRNWLRNHFPTKWKTLLRPLAANIPLRLRFECYDKISEERLLRGEMM
ncbi:MAG: class I SAM-dependent methyltransferase [Chthoniobacterales bacterium]